MEENVGYAEGSIREYLNIKRSSKDKCCAVIFGIYVCAFGIFIGIGLFFGNIGNIGTFIGEGTNCPLYLSCTHQFTKILPQTMPIAVK